jgi:hypothetical protein
VKAPCRSLPITPSCISPSECVFRTLMGHFYFGEMGHLSFGTTVLVENTQNDTLAHISLLPFKHLVPNGTYFIEEEDKSDSQESVAPWSASLKP